MVNIVTLASKASSVDPLDQEDSLFIHFVNFVLRDDIQIAQLLPIGHREVDVSSAFVDGVILWYVSPAFCLPSVHFEERRKEERNLIY